MTENVFSEFVDRLTLRSSAYHPVPVLPRNARPSPSKGMTQLFSLDEVRQFFSSREQLTTLKSANSCFFGVPRQYPVTSIAALAPVPPHSGPTQTGPSDERPPLEVPTFTKEITTPGQHGVPFQQAHPRAPITGMTSATAARRPKRLALTTGPRPQPTGLLTKPSGMDESPMEPIHPPGVTAPRADIVNYLRKTNICFSFAFGLQCPRHLTWRCPLVHGIIFEGAFTAANPPPTRKSYGTRYVRPPRRLFALTDEVQNLLIAWGIATPDIDQPKKKKQIDGKRTTYDDAQDEDIRALKRDA